MTISVTIKNEDSRPNAIIEVLSTDQYQAQDRDTVYPTRRAFQSEAILRGGESKTVMLCSSKSLEIIERRNDN